MGAQDTSSGTRRPHDTSETLVARGAAREIVLGIPGGSGLDPHAVHEHGWFTVIEGDVEITTDQGEQIFGTSGLLVELAPGERHTVRACSESAVILLLTPGPAGVSPSVPPLLEGFAPTS